MIDLLRQTELNHFNFPEFRDTAFAADQYSVEHSPKTYRSNRHIKLHPYAGGLIDQTKTLFLKRRSMRSLGVQNPSRQVFSNILYLSFGVTHPAGLCPVPSAGGRNPLSLFYWNLHDEAWLETGMYHYNRLANQLDLLNMRLNREHWSALIYSSVQFTGGCGFWIITGDNARLKPKYGVRSQRFLLLEAGHLMQNLCLLSSHYHFSTLPLGGFNEGKLSRLLDLPQNEYVLYVGAFGGAES
jgi:SagB-type dehydrogenase family enzyme